ncbi:PE-PPE domain-containing protein [Mycolicibacter sp. MYC123]|uniref:PE-PPE domain-containing protein n=1 Tax=[Mycobacterium] zoologicum TaxID=2872311 RepID=A0ABU5YNG0_9MYCO|nr:MULTISPECIES: PE-PPE domain-containing protein [unclassified Mycolicibacter]MEB3050979.1 PE-PPE domain-containing protein [Mycolicibacter sp. MYC123]MEB3063926.1 PE-PPE domain-containing protein [Mycolicibacter sp. MYC101]
MTGRIVHSLGIMPLAITSAAALGVVPATNPAVPTGAKTVLTQVNLLDTEAWIMGGSGLPIPPPSYIDALFSRYIDPTTPFFPDQPRYPVDATNGLFTPEGLYPNSGVKSLELDPSLAQGVSILHDTISKQVAAGNDLVVLGYSQSSTISTMVMRDLMALPADQRPTADQLSFVLLGAPNNPNGGLFERFNVLDDGSYPTIPSLGITFNGAIPDDTPWSTSVYTLEYDGYADFPKYPINFLSDLNAVLGIIYEHTIYPTLTPEQLATAIEMPMSEGYDGNAHYFMIPSEILPLLMPLQSIPVIGQPLYDLLEPDMRILVNLGYGSITDGWAAGPADVATPFEAFPTDLNWGEVFTALGAGAQQGVSDFIDDLSHLSLPSAADLLSGTGDVAAMSMPSLTDIVNAFTSITSTAYAALLPTADILNAMLTTAPAYAAGVFAQELAQGDILNAIGLPLAGVVGLGTLAAGFEFLALNGAVADITATIQDLFQA